jgi:hypothetical protein
MQKDACSLYKSSCALLTAIVSKLWRHSVLPCVCLIPEASMDREPQGKVQTKTMMRTYSQERKDLRARTIKEIGDMEIPSREATAVMSLLMWFCLSQMPYLRALLNTPLVVHDNRGLYFSIYLSAKDSIRNGPSHQRIALRKASIRHAQTGTCFGRLSIFFVFFVSFCAILFASYVI